MADYCRVWLLAHYLQITPLVTYAIWRVLSIKDGGDRIHFLDIETLYEQAPADSELRKLLVHLCVWGEKERLDLSPTLPHSMLRDLVLEIQRKCVPAQKSPLMDVRNYYVKVGRKMLEQRWWMRQR